MEDVGAYGLTTSHQAKENIEMKNNIVTATPSDQVSLAMCESVFWLVVLAS